MARIPIASRPTARSDGLSTGLPGALLTILLTLAPSIMHAQTLVQTTLPGSGNPLSVALPLAGPGPTPTAGAPVVVSLHYGGPVTPYYGRGLLEGVVAPGLASLAAVMVAPDCAAGAWIDRACAADVFEAIEIAAALYGGDPHRVLLVGYSKGGIGAWALSDAHPDRFAAVIVMAGRASGPRFADRTAVPATVIHGERDELFALAAVRAAARARSAAGQDVSVTVLPGVSHYDTGAFVEPLRDAAPDLARQLSR